MNSPRMMTPAEIVWERATEDRKNAKINDFKKPTYTGKDNDPDIIPDGELPWE